MPKHPGPHNLELRRHGIYSIAAIILIEGSILGGSPHSRNWVVTQVMDLPYGNYCELKWKWYNFGYSPFFGFFSAIISELPWRSMWKALAAKLAPIPQMHHVATEKERLFVAAVQCLQLRKPSLSSCWSFHPTRFCTFRTLWFFWLSGKILTTWTIAESSWYTYLCMYVYIYIYYFYLFIYFFAILCNPLPRSPSHNFPLTHIKPPAGVPSSEGY